jgi:hypothetical protein
METTYSPETGNIDNPELTLEDLIKIQKQSLGLRHVSSREKALQEAKEGFTGDGLAIASVNHLNTNEADRLLQYKQALLNFFKDSLGMDINSQPEVEQKKVGQIVDDLAAQSTFVVAQFQDADNGYDSASYYDLGKAGRQRITPEKIKELLTLSPDDFHELTPEVKGKVMGSETFQMVKSHGAEALYRKLTTTVKGF